MCFPYGQGKGENKSWGRRREKNNLETWVWILAQAFASIRILMSLQHPLTLSFHSYKMRSIICPQSCGENKYTIRLKCIQMIFSILRGVWLQENKSRANLRGMKLPQPHRIPLPTASWKTSHRTDKDIHKANAHGMLSYFWENWPG